ncbi:MAG: DUF1501 domain-containing protein [Chitinophagaceae bacterium]|nr:DUF1501 domain-containing protein [Chitinophagaceae bacterium]
MHISRKKFIQTTGLATASFMVPKFLKAFEEKNHALVPQGNKVLVVLQLSGGNDGLNTIIPVRNDIYYRERPRIKIEKNQDISLTDEASIHPALKGLADIYHDGGMAILNNVGYPNPDRSHFRSMDIWQSASNSNEYVNSGWVGRFLDAQCKGCDKPTYALEFDDVLSLALKGEQEKGLAFKDPRRLFNSSQSNFFKAMAQQHHNHHEESPVDYLYKTMTNTISSAEYIFSQSQSRLSKAEYPNTELGKNFKTIASLIFSEINTKVYYVSLGSFDTHVNQQAQQQRLFTDLNNAITSFVKDLKTNNRFDDVLLMSFSEFGRRVSQNASGGTDHGTANNMFLIGGGLKQKGLLNEMPNLNNLQNGDLTYTEDFKNVYATILNKWLNAKDEDILKDKYNIMNFI